jgi:hypothetical protein
LIGECTASHANSARGTSNAMANAMTAVRRAGEREVVATASLGVSTRSVEAVTEEDPKATCADRAI